MQTTHLTNVSKSVKAVTEATKEMQSEELNIFDIHSTWIY